MKYITLLVLAMTALVNTASAKLGETVDEIEARYGKAKALGTDQNDHLGWRRYRYQEYDITVRFLDGKSVCEKLLHRTESQKFLDVECLGLGKAITGENNWNLFDQKGPATAWTSGEGMVLRSEIASESLSPFIEITGKVYREHMEKTRTAETIKQIDYIAERFDSPAYTAKK